MDVDVVTPHPACEARAAPSTDGALARAMERRKRARYPALALFPGVFEHLGRPGMDLVAFLRQVIRGPGPAERSAAIASAWRRLSVAAQRGDVAMLCAAGQLID